MEFDIIYINESTECSLDDIEFCRMRIGRRRKSNLPFHQLIMDMNPDAPTHFLNIRMNEGITTRILSRHQDNPFLWDMKTNDWTAAGRNYIHGVLGGLSGVRRARYLFGEWAAAEGTVYEGVYDRKRNVIKRFDIPASWPRYMSIDFGFRNPFVCKWYAEDEDGRLYCYREIYMTGRLVEEHARQIKELSRWGEPGGDPLPREIHADHEAEGIATLQRHLGVYVMRAHKAVSEGIQCMSARLRLAGDGKPRLMYFDDCLVERDPELVRQKKPTCTVEEFDCYCWDTRQGQRKGEVPLKENDHGMDSCRYISCRDLNLGSVGNFALPW